MAKGYATRDTAAQWNGLSLMANNNDTVRRSTWDERRPLSAQITPSESCRRPTEHYNHSMFLDGVDNPATGLHDARR
jgi:hypothetical protein